VVEIWAAATTAGVAEAAGAVAEGEGVEEEEELEELEEWAAGAETVGWSGDSRAGLRCARQYCRPKMTPSMTIIMMRKERLSWLPPPPLWLGLRNSGKRIPTLSKAGMGSRPANF
jgi:hypothetical protein